MQFTFTNVIKANAIINSILILRKQSEEQVKALEVTDEFGVCLTELVLNTGAGLGLRQLAAVMLKQ